MQVGGVNFKVSLDLGDLDKQLSKAQNLIRNSKVDFNIADIKGASAIEKNITNLVRDRNINVKVNDRDARKSLKNIDGYIDNIPEKLSIPVELDSGNILSEAKQVKDSVTKEFASSDWSIPFSFSDKQVENETQRIKSYLQKELSLEKIFDEKVIKELTKKPQTGKSGKKKGETVYSATNTDGTRQLELNKLNDIVKELQSVNKGISSLNRNTKSPNIVVSAISSALGSMFSGAFSKLGTMILSKILEKLGLGDEISAVKIQDEKITAAFDRITDLLEQIKKNTKPSLLRNFFGGVAEGGGRVAADKGVELLRKFDVEGKIKFAIQKGKDFAGVLGNFGDRLYKESGFENFNKKFKDSFSGALVDALNDSITRKELFVNLAKNIGKALTSEEVLGAAKEAALKTVNPKTYTNATGLTSEEGRTLLQGLGSAHGPKETALQTPIVRAIGKFIAPLIDKALTKDRDKNLQDKAVPLVLKRAAEILKNTELGSRTQEEVDRGIARANRVRGRLVGGVDAASLALGRMADVDAPTSITPETKELIITIGGYAGDVGHASGLRIAGDLIHKFSEMGKKDIAAIGVKNPDGNLKNAAKDKPIDKVQSLFTSLVKPHLRGYSEDAVEMASQALSAILASPDIKVKFLGESGGGFAAEEATQILNLMGYAKNVEGAGFGTPNFIAGMNPENFKKYIGKNPEEPLGYEVHNAYAPAGFADVSLPEQNLVGLSGHPYEQYATTEPFKTFVYNKNRKVGGEPDPEADKQLAAAIEAEIKQISLMVKDITKIPLNSSKDIKNYLKAIEDSLLALNIDDRIFGDEKAEELKAETEKIINAINTELPKIEFLAPFKAALARGEEALTGLFSSGASDEEMTESLKILMKESAKIQLTLLEAAQSGTTDLTDSLTEHFKTFQTKIKNWALSSREEITLDMITQSTEERLKDLFANFDAELANTYLNAINETVESFDIDSASNANFSNANLEKLRSMATTLQEMLSQNVEEIVEQVEEGIEDEVAEVDVEENLSLDSINLELESLEDNVLSIIQNVNERVTEMGERINFALQNAIPSTLGSSLADILLEDLEEPEQGETSGRGGDEGESILSFDDDLEGILGIESLDQNQIRLFEESINKYRQILDDQSDVISNITDELQRIDPQGTLRFIFKKLQKVNIGEDLKERFEDQGISFEDFDAGDLEERFINVYQDLVSDIQTLSDTGYGADIVDTASELSARVSKAIVDGFLEGSNEESIANLALGVALAFIDKLEEKFQIRSPSKWAYKIGKFIIQGLADGISAGESLLENITENVVEPIRENISEAVNAGQESLANMSQAGGQAIGGQADIIGNLAQEFFDDSGIGDLSSEIRDSLGPRISNVLERVLEPLGNFKDKAIELLAAPFVFIGSASLLNDFNNFTLEMAKEGFQLAVDFERITTATTFIIGSAQKAQQKIKALRDSARELGLNESIIENYNQLAAATRNTALEGKDTDVLADALNHAAAAFSLSEEQIQGAYVAVQQIAGKGTVSAEELRGQLAERIPGAFQIAARAMKVSEQELFQMMSSGSLSAADFLPALGRQLKIETMGGVQEASKTTFAMLQKMDNSLNRIRLSMGEKLLPIAKAGLSVINAALSVTSDHLDAILTVINTGLMFALTHATTILAPFIKGAFVKGLAMVTPILAKITVGLGSVTGAASALMGVLSVLNKSIFLKLFVIVEGIKAAYSMMRTIFGALDFSDNSALAEQTVWDDVAKRIKQTTKSIKADLKGLDEAIDDSLFGSRKLEHKGFFENAANVLVNDNPLYDIILGEEKLAKRREELSKMSIWGWSPFDRQGRIASFASMREDDYLMDLEERTREIDKMLNSQKIMESLTSAKQGGGDLVKITSLDEQISKLTTIKSLLEPQDVARREELSKEIRKLQDERELLSTDYVAAQTGYMDYIKVIEAELESATDPQAIGQLNAARASAKKLLDLMAQYEAENGPINVAKKFALALQELDFAFDSIAQNAERATVIMQRGFAQQKLEEFNTNFFAESEIALKESNARLKIIENEAQLTQDSLRRIAANLENNPSYNEALNYIKKEEAKLGRTMNAADIEYFKEKTASSEDQNLINAFDAEIKIRTKMAELDQKLLEKDELALEVQNQRQSLILEKLDRQKEIADINQQIVEARNREIAAEMALGGEDSAEINAFSSLQNLESVKTNKSNIEIDKKLLEDAFKKGEISAREYESRINQVNVELANLNAELAEAKLQSEEALSDRLLDSIDQQITKLDHSLSVGQIERETGNLKQYENDLSSLSQAYINLNQATRSSEGEIADLNAQLNQSKQVLDSLVNSGLNSEAIRDRISETKRQIETQSAELVRAQVQANQSIKEAREAAILADIDKAFDNAQHKNSIAELDEEYKDLSNQLKSLEGDALSPQAEFEKAVSQSKSAVEKLNKELSINKDLLYSLQSSGVNTPEVRERIENLGKEIETKEKEISIARKQSEIDIFNSRSEMLERIKAQEEEILKVVEKQNKDFEHNAEIEDLNKEYEKVLKEYSNIGNDSPLLAFQNTVDESNNKVYQLERNVRKVAEALKTLEKSPATSEAVKDKIEETKRELEVEELKLKIGQAQSKIDVSKAKESLQKTTEELIKQNVELENIINGIEKIEQKISIINIESKEQEEISKKISNEYSQRLSTLSQINGFFKEINIHSQELFSIEKSMNREKSKMDLKDLRRRLVTEEDLLDVNKEKQNLEYQKTDVEALSKIEEAQDSLAKARLTKDSNAIKNAEKVLDIARKERRLLLDKQRTTDIIYSKEKGILALRSESEIKMKKTEMANQAFKDALDDISFSVQKINKQFEKQATYLNSYKDLFSAQTNFLQQSGNNELKELDFGRNIIKQLKQADISSDLKNELEAQLKALGINPSSTEADVLLEAFKVENKLAEERLEILKQQQEIDKTLLEMDLRKAELDARSAVVQAKVLEAWGKMMGGVDSSGLVEEAIANLDFTRQQGSMARQAQSINQSSEVNQMMTEDWFRKLQQRQDIVAADGYNGGLGGLGKKPKLEKPNLKIPKLNTEIENTESFNEGLVFNEEGFGGRIGEILREQLELLGPNLNIVQPKEDYKTQEFKENPSIPDFSPMTKGVTETNNILSDMRELMKEQNKKKQNNVDLTVVSSDAVVDAGKMLNDITKPF